MIEVPGFSSNTKYHIVYPNLPLDVYHTHHFPTPESMPFIDNDHEMEYGNLEDKNHKGLPEHFIQAELKDLVYSLHLSKKAAWATFERKPACTRNQVRIL